MLLETLLSAALMSTATPVKLEAPVLVAQAAPAAEAQQPAAPAPAPKATPAPKAAPAAPAKPAAEAKKDAAGPKEMAPEVKSLVDRMQAFYENTTDFTADFEQNYKYKAFKRTSTSTGTIIYKKPGLMRWNYLKPGERTFVLAGNKIYAHDPEAMMLTVGSIDTSKLSASVTFLFGQGRLENEFDIEKTACKSCKGTLLTLTPKTPDPRFRRIMLEVDPKTAQVLKSTVVDPDGSENAITFKNLKTNTGVDAAAFKLNPPEGTSVQDFTKQAAGGGATGGTATDAGKK